MSAGLCSTATLHMCLSSGLYYWNLSGGFLIRALVRRGDEPKVERLLDFPPHLPLLTTRAFPFRTPLPGVFAFDLVSFEAEWRLERASALLAAMVPESCFEWEDGNWLSNRCEISGVRCLVRRRSSVLKSCLGRLEARPSFSGSWQLRFSWSCVPCQ
jgi:hypothetical protein